MLQARGASPCRGVTRTELSPKPQIQMLRELIQQNRSCRRFQENQPVAQETLRELADFARLSASGGNFQPLKYYLSSAADSNAKIFPHLSWAGYLKDWPGPAEGERPAAYILILGDTDIKKSFGCDHGIAAQSILLGAVEKGLRGCIIGMIQRQALTQALNIPPRYEILLAIALGQPAETALVEPVREDGSIQYWRDAGGTHHVPKRSLDDVIIGQA